MNHPAPESQEEVFVRELTSHHDALMRFVRILIPNGSDAEDIFQKASVTLWKKHLDYDQSRPFYTWACRFLHFEVLNHRKKMARDRLSFSEDLIESLAVEHNEVKPELESRRLALNRCIEKLSYNDQKILQRRYQENNTIAELALELNRPVKQLYKSLEKLRRSLFLCVGRTTNRISF